MIKNNKTCFAVESLTNLFLPHDWAKKSQALPRLWKVIFNPRLEFGPVIECIFHCLLHFESLVKCKMYPKSTPELLNHSRIMGAGGEGGGGKGSPNKPLLSP